MTDPGGVAFVGIPPAGFAFLRALADHNDRAWFTPRKAEYQASVEAPLRALAAATADQLRVRKIPLTCDPLKAVFRIHRDIRFSPDKRPYKTHAGAVLSRDGTKDGGGVLYVHVEPGGSFAACGLYQPGPPVLAALRSAIAARPDRFERALAPIRNFGLDLSRDDALKRAPRGFETVAEPTAALLRLRHLIVRRDLPDEAFGRPEIVTALADLAAACQKLLVFCWSVSDGVPTGRRSRG